MLLIFASYLRIKEVRFIKIRDFKNLIDICISNLPKSISKFRFSLERKVASNRNPPDITSRAEFLKHKIKILNGDIKTLYDIDGLYNN